MRTNTETVRIHERSWTRAIESARPLPSLIKVILSLNQFPPPSCEQSSSAMCNLIAAPSQTSYSTVANSRRLNVIPHSKRVQLPPPPPTNRKYSWKKTLHQPPQPPTNRPGSTNQALLQPPSSLTNRNNSLNEAPHQLPLPPTNRKILKKARHQPSAASIARKESLKKALNLRKTSGLSLRKCAKRLGVSPSTLTRYAADESRFDKKAGRPGRFTEKEEQLLVQAANCFADHGMPLSRDSFRDMVQTYVRGFSIARQRQIGFTNCRPGQTFVRNFLERNKEVRLIGMATRVNCNGPGATTCISDPTSALSPAYDPTQS